MGTSCRTRRCCHTSSCLRRLCPCWIPLCRSLRCRSLWRLCPPLCRLPLCRRRTRRRRLVTISHVTVLECVVELVACLAAIEADGNAYRYSLVAAQCLQLLHGHPEVDRVRIPFLRLASSLAVSLGHDPKPYNKQLSELRYSGIKTEGAASLLEVIRDKYIHTATRTARAW